MEEQHTKGVIVRGNWRRSPGVLGGILWLSVLVGVQSAASQQINVTPVTGESWLAHLHRSFDDTSMGKTGRLGPPGEDSEGHAANLLDSAEKTEGNTLLEVRSEAMRTEGAVSVSLRGSDVYRMSCRGCHGESGAGAPPEIGSLLNPVRATSPALVRARMQSLGSGVSAGQAAEMAQQSRDALLERIHKGGQDMPPFSHLNEAEVGALLAYLKQLAEVPGAGERELAVTEPRTRAGELIVRSTCHVCHDAEGANPSPEQIAAGAIPPLSALTTRVDEQGLIRKVTEGAPIVMGTPPAACRGRMPVFFYLSRDEAADVYLYLTEYRPKQVEVANAGGAIASRANSGVGAEGGENPFASFVVGPRAKSAAKGNLATLARKSDPAFGVWLVLVAVAGLSLIAAGWMITLREFRRMESESTFRKRIQRDHAAEIRERGLIPLSVLAARAAGERGYRPRESA